MIEQYKAFDITKVEQLKDAIPDMTDKDLADMYHDLKGVHNTTLDFEEALKVELRSRYGNGGSDEKGNVYISGTKNAVKLERRMHTSLEPEAMSILEELGVLDLFPQEPDIIAMKMLLNACEVPTEAYMKPAVTPEAIIALVDEGKIPEEVAGAIIKVKFKYAVKRVETKELPDGAGSGND